MDNTKSTNRLNQQQKTLLNAARDLNLLAFDVEDTFETIDVSKFKKYVELHDQLKKILETTNMEPHEIYTLINTYSGSFKGFQELKNFVKGRNLCIIKKIKDTIHWQKQINKLANKIADKYIIVDENKTKLNELINGMVFQILMREVNTFDILQHKLSLDNKNNVNGFTLTSDDQKYLLLELMKEKVIIKK